MLTLAFNKRFLTSPVISDSSFDISAASPDIAGKYGIDAPDMPSLRHILQKALQAV